MIPKMGLLGDVEGPTQFVVKHPHARVKYMQINKIDSMLSTDICIGHLDHAYGDDVHGEVWPVRNEML